MSNCQFGRRLRKTRLTYTQLRITRTAYTQLRKPRLTYTQLRKPRLTYTQLIRMGVTLLLTATKMQQLLVLLEPSNPPTKGL